MRSGCKKKPRLSRIGLGFLFSLVGVIALLLVPAGDAIPSVMKMPRPLPDIVKAYKSVNLPAGRIGMLDTGVQLKQGDYITIPAKGAINVCAKCGGNLQHPVKKGETTDQIVLGVVR